MAPKDKKYNVLASLLDLETKGVYDWFMESIIWKFTLLLLCFLPYQVSAGCNAPSKPFFEEKLRNGFQIDTAERMLKTIVLDPKNYETRLDIKNDRSQFKVARWNDRPKHNLLIRDKFQQINENTGYNEPLVDFPYPEAKGFVKASDKGSLELVMENLNMDELKFLPPSILDKMARKASVHYFYPSEKFEVFLTYDNKEMAMNKFLDGMQDEFETACMIHKNEKKEFKKKFPSGSSQ